MTGRAGGQTGPVQDGSQGRELSPGSGPLGRHPALDGVRAVAIVLVLLFHVDRGNRFPLLSGGFLGVDVFFVLSGFLITSLLVDEIGGTGRVRLGAFWGRRAARLFPLLWLLLVVEAFARWVHPIAGVRPPTGLGFLALLGYGGNWLQATGHHGLNGLAHLWSLSVEEQFYVAWPIVVALALAVRSRRRLEVEGTSEVPGTRLATLGLLATGGALTVAVLRVTAFRHVDYFFNTGLRCDGLLLGSALGATRRWWQPRVGPAIATVAILLGAIGTYRAVHLGVVGSLSVARWRLPLVEVAAVLLTAGLVGAPRAPLARLAASPPLVWLGRRSYALYLVHAPVFELVLAHLPLERWRVRALVGIVGAVGLAHVLHVFVEQPAQRRMRRLLRADHEVSEPPAGGSAAAPAA